MLALYGSGRQMDALDVYRQTRRLLVDELGVEPSPALQDLETAILRHDPALTPQPIASALTQRAIMVIAREAHRLDDLLAIAEPLARRPARELIITRLLDDDGEIAGATAELAERRQALRERGVRSRVAAYTTDEPANEATRFATEHDVDLVLVDASPGLLESGRPGNDLWLILERVPSDVAVLVGSGNKGEGAIVTPFGGVENEWTAIEIAAWLAEALGTTLRLLGTEAEPAVGRRDASRLLARASLLVQQVVGIVTEPVLVPAGEGGVLEAAGTLASW